MTAPVHDHEAAGDEPVLAEDSAEDLAGGSPGFVDTSAHVGDVGTHGRPAWRTPLLAGVAATAGCVAIAVVDPTDSGVPICWSQAVFHVDCPLCGGLRAVGSMMRGHFLVAADHNVFVAVFLPLIAVAWIVWVVAAMWGRPVRLPHVPRWVFGVLAVVAIAFTVARNVGGPAWVDWLASTTYR